jgi:hypothetical protein
MSSVVTNSRAICRGGNSRCCSLTAEYLQHEVNTALLRFADNDGSIVVIPANMQGFEMILDSGQLRRGN